MRGQGKEKRVSRKKKRMDDEEEKEKSWLVGLSWQD